MMFGPRPSLRDYFEEVSYGKFSYTPAHPATGVLDPGNDGVWPHFYMSGFTQANMWIVLGVTRNWPNIRALAAQAMQLADPDINYALHDTDADGFVEPDELTINIITSGKAADMGGLSPWSHMYWTNGPVPTADGVQIFDPALVAIDGVGGAQYSMTSEDNPMGTTAHELGHQLGLPDLYDYDVLPAEPSEGIGNYGLMGGGGWCGPTHPTAWSKWWLGWIFSFTWIGANGYYDIHDVETNEEAYALYRGGGPFPMGNEFFLVENRWKGTSYDSIPGPYGHTLPDEGILIYHIDYGVWGPPPPPWNPNDVEEHKFIDVECMDSPSSHFVNADDLDKEWDRGDATDLWGGRHWSFNHGWVDTYDFHGYSTPCDSKLYSGLVSRIDVRDIPPPSPTMTVLLSIIEWYLSDWPFPFVSPNPGELDTAFIVGSTAPHGPYNWQAWTADVLGGIGISSRLGLDAWNDGWVEWFVDTDVAAYAPGPIVTVNWPTITKGAIITIGGPAVNIMTLRYEQFSPHDPVPFYMTGLPGSPVIHSDLTGNDYGTVPGPGGSDHFIYAMHYDAEADKFVLVAYGNTAKGTQAACFAIQHYFPFPQQVRGVILRWDDLNGNNFVDFADIPFWIIETWP